MNSPAIRRRAAALALAVGLACCLSGHTHADTAPPQPTNVVFVMTDRGFNPGACPDGAFNPGTRGTTSYLDRLQQIAAGLTERWKTPVLLDPALVLTARPPVPAHDLSLDQALDAALTPLHHAAWRRIYLTQGQRESLPSPESLAAAARALEQREQGSIIVEDLATKHLTACLKDQPVSSTQGREMSVGRFSTEPVYLVLSTTASAEGKSPESEFANLQRQQLEMPVQPEQMALAMAQMMRLLQEMPPAAREEFAGRTLQAGRKLWDSTPPDQRQEMIQQSMQLMQRFGTAPNGPAGKTENRAPRPPIRPAPTRDPGELKTIAAALAARYNATFVIDPTVLLAASLQMPDPGLPIEKALTAMAAPHTGIAWRQVYLTEEQRRRLPSAEKLAATARALDQWEAGSMILENASAQRATTFLKDQPVPPSLRPLLEEGKLSAEPIYLLYSTTPSAHGETLEARFADLQRQQMGLMLRMGSEQMAQSMEQVIQTFPSADAAIRERLMGLPAMAGMMAVWFPQAAKERQQAPAP